MESSEKTSDLRESKEPSTLKMTMFSLGYFLNTFVIIAFNNFVWTFYEGELGMISFVALWPIYMAIANVIYTIWSMEYEEWGGFGGSILCRFRRRRRSTKFLRFT